MKLNFVKIYIIIVQLTSLSFYAQEDVKMVKIEEPKNEIIGVPYSIVEEKPYFPGCEKDMEKVNLCVEDKFYEFVDAHFNKNIARELNMEGNVKIFTSFDIDIDGKIINIRVKSQNASKHLDEETKRVLDLMPKLVPGKQNGDVVIVKYTLVISFYIESKKNTTDKLEVISDEDDTNIPFTIIEQVPVYPGCEGNFDEIKNCFIDKVTLFVAKNYNVSIADKTNLEGKVRVIVNFTIDKYGNVKGVVAHAPHTLLEEEAVRVIKKLPQMTPGKQRGKSVEVKYSMPIILFVEAKKKNN